MKHNLGFTVKRIICLIIAVIMALPLSAFAYRPTVGDEEKQNDVTARIMNERMLVPMRFPAIELNYNVDRDATNREMRIEMK